MGRRVTVVCRESGLSPHRRFFALIEPVEGGRGSAATGGLPGTVALARSIVTPSAPCMRRGRGSRTPFCAMTESRSPSNACGHPVGSCCARISWGVGPSRYPQGAHWLYVTPWSHCRAPHWGQGCSVAWSTGNRCGAGAEGSSGVIGSRTLLWRRQGSRCPSPAHDALWCAGRAALQACTSMGHRRVGPRGTVWLLAGD